MDTIVRLYAKVFLGLLGGFYFPQYKVAVLVVKRLFPSFAWAQTFGNTILIREDLAQLSFYRSGTFCEAFAHELVHVDQYRRLGTLRFLVSYLLSSVRSLLFGKDYYLENEFEREAYRLQSRYCEEYVKGNLDELVKDFELVFEEYSRRRGLFRS